MTLNDTIELMKSNDYKDRFKAEYYQVKIRYDKLMSILDNWSNLDFTPTCTKHMLEQQCEAMKDYLDILKKRSELEGVKL